MPARARHAVRTLARAAAWPWRRATFTLARWQRGHIYGWRQPAWWPNRIDAWIGPASPHENKRVVIFAGVHRYEFAPAAHGRFRGHVHHGVLRPDEADIADRLMRMGLPTGPARALAIVSRFEGGFDAIQTYDAAKFTWGFIQFTATGGLPRLLQDLKVLAPAAFGEHFVAAGIDLAADGRIVVRRRGQTFEGRRAHNKLHDDPALWTPFLAASRVPIVQDVQVRNAHEYYYQHPLKAVVRIAGEDVSLASLFADSELARAVVFDRAVNKGVGYATTLFRKAVVRVGTRSAIDVEAILDVVRMMEAADSVRLDAIAQQVRGR